MTRLSPISTTKGRAASFDTSKKASPRSSLTRRSVVFNSTCTLLSVLSVILEPSASGTVLMAPTLVR